MRSAETAVVWDAHLGGYPVCMMGIESKPVPRFGFVPADGPRAMDCRHAVPAVLQESWRAPSTAASNNRPVVVLANLSGFDGSPESMRRLQLEYGAEIGRAVVNFKGPDGVLRGLALSRRRLRGFLASAERAAWKSARWKELMRR